MSHFRRHSRHLSTALLALLLIEVLYGAWWVMWSGATSPAVFFGGDHEAYRNGALRLIATGSPYDASLHVGPIANVIENVPIGYLYPPVLAQVFVPLASIPPIALAIAAAAAQLILLAVLLPLVYQRYGGRLDARGLLQVWLATAISFPVHMAAFGGNLSGWIAIGVAVMLLAPGAPGGIAAAALALMKMTPAVLLVPVLFAGREMRRGAVGFIGVVTAASIVVAPEAWIDWVRVLPNILQFPPPVDSVNYAPAAVFGSYGFRPIGALAGVALAAAAVVTAAVLARRGRWPAAVAAATTALLLGPSSIWDHYLTMTIPLIIAAWPLAGPASRALLGALLAVHALHWVLVPPATEVRALYLAALIVGCFTAIDVLRRRAPAVETDPAFAPSAATAPELAPAATP